MHPTTTVTLVDGVRVVVPDTLDLITPYVLQEQGDWFEDEIKFLRRLLRPGQQVIDIGANYGVYALSMARAVGPAGRVWAFEPASDTAELLAAGIHANGFDHVSLEQCALSSTSGSAQLSLRQDPEMNALVRGALVDGRTETVHVLTLDECLDGHGWRGIEFVKMDAEGEEGAILRGGTRFFDQESPLVQYEIKAGEDLHLGLVAAFTALGYASYRLVPGVDVLVPFDATQPADGFLLNLFACKPDRAARLAAAGFLVEKAGSRPGYIGAAQNWRTSVARLAYARPLAAGWERTVAAGTSAAVEEALALYAASREPGRPAAERYAALEAGFIGLRNLCAREPAWLRLSTLARLARDYGARTTAAMTLAKLCDSLLQRGGADPGEPFLPPGARFDSVEPRGALGDWILAAVLEEIERGGSHSSFYTGMGAKQRLEVIRQLGYGSAEMQRRLSLLRRRFGLPES